MVSDQDMDEGEVLETRTAKIKRFINEAIRVLRVTKKPSKDEFLTVVKVTGLGMLIIGAIGFIIFIISRFI